MRARANSILRKTGHRAFSLVEVALALGVVSFAVLSMLGVVSVGLTTVKDATEQTMHAQIIKHVGSTILQTPFDQIKSYTDEAPLYFDQAGREVKTAAESLYQVELEFKAGGSYPGAPSNLSNSVSTIQIEVATKPGGIKDALSKSSTSLLVPKS